jgi:type VI secretion system protein VasG
MSEFQEAHTVSTLKGAPPGYVGYGEGGVLTEAVRRKPYSAWCCSTRSRRRIPTCTRSSSRCSTRAWMEDGEGRLIDFKNTLILLTSNVGTDMIVNLCKDPELMPEPEGIAKALRSRCSRCSRRRCSGGLVTIPYYPLSDEMMGDIIRLQLGRIAKRIGERHGVPFTYDEAVVKLIASRCTEPESGGRMIDAILTNTMLPAIRSASSTRMPSSIARISASGRWRTGPAATSRGRSRPTLSPTACGPSRLVPSRRRRCGSCVAVSRTYMTRCGRRRRGAGEG